MKKILVLVLACFAFFTGKSQCHLDEMTALGQPASVAGAHIHAKGDWMFNYQFKFMQMKNMQSEKDAISQEQVFEDYDMYGTKMTMPMHMFMAMYGLSDRLNFMVMTHYMTCDMDMLHQMGMMTHEMNSTVSGFGDSRLAVIYSLAETKNSHWIASAGISMPTGSIDNQRFDQMNMPMRMGYPMQLGSGTIDPYLQISLLKSVGKWSLGAQGESIMRFGRNKESYRLGNAYKMSAWLAHPISQNLVAGVKAGYAHHSKVEGRKGEMSMANPMMDAGNTGYDRMNASVFIGYKPTESLPFSLHAEAQLPVMNRVNGVQMDIDITYVLGIKVAI